MLESVGSHQAASQTVTHRPPRFDSRQCGSSAGFADQGGGKNDVVVSPRGNLNSADESVRRAVQEITNQPIRHQQKELENFIRKKERL